MFLSTLMATVISLRKSHSSWDPSFVCFLKKKPADYCMIIFQLLFGRHPGRAGGYRRSVDDCKEAEMLADPASALRFLLHCVSHRPQVITKVKLKSQFASIASHTASAQEPRVVGGLCRGHHEVWFPSWQFHSTGQCWARRV